ncbi:histone-lysine N-methyltransferase, H3 lysine-9 specific SUVH5-like [Lotus japonicus]|uniref:histone-lysine N-methyltransferase, H3 lysine-9 specific SUVH5-like n=1 Tax=Lotus japonicus TaxID=34305 RepID=UPI00258AED41|nr:histone-lysine N-methyltransferase, H3 lysine-9 specific SUVH5-like [Lotus japonicus]
MSSDDIQQVIRKNAISWGQVGPRSGRLLVRGRPQSSRMGEDHKRNISRRKELFGVSKPKRSMKRNRNSSIRKSKMKKNAREVILGAVPGIEVGDEFQSKKELSIVGLHGQIMRGIDYVTGRDGRTLAVSVVSSGSYDDKLENKELLTYIGEGGNLNKYKNGAPLKDQKLTRGNLALKNSYVVKNPVRVIHKRMSKDGSRDVFVYYGIYEVDSYCPERGEYGNNVYKFKLRRKLDQPQVIGNELKIKSQSQADQPQVIGNELKKSQSQAGHPHVIDHDLSNGSEF